MIKFLGATAFLALTRAASPASAQLLGGGGGLGGTLGGNLGGPSGSGEARFVVSWDTPEEDVDALCDYLRNMK